MWFIVLLLLSSCILENNSKPKEQKVNHQTRLLLEKAGDFKKSPDIVEYKMTIKGPNRESYQDSGVYHNSITFPDIPPGSDLSIQIELKNANHEIMYTCLKSDLSISSETTSKITLTCFPEFSEVWLYLPLNYAPWVGIDSGLFQIFSSHQDTLVYPLKFTQGSAEIAPFTVPGNSNYTVSLQLWKKGALAFQTTENTTLYFKKGVSENLSIPIHPQLGQAEISLNFSGSKQNHISIYSVKNKRRLPGPQEILISEIYPEPLSEQGDSDAEWLEISNPTSDTLLLSDCFISRTRNSTGVTSRQDLTELGALLPYQSIVLGKEKVSFRNFPLNLSLLNTRQSLIVGKIQNNETVILDSLTYSSTATSLDTLSAGQGKILVRSSRSFGLKNHPSNWCTAQDSTLYKSTPRQLYTRC